MPFRRAGFFAVAGERPVGYIKNNKTGIDLKWKSKGYAFDPEQKARMLAEAAEKLQSELPSKSGCMSRPRSVSPGR
jgi:phage/plasmid primase-like uncharacterized protein